MLYLKIFSFLIGFLLFNALTAADEKVCEQKYIYDASIPGNITSPFYGEREYPEDLNCNYVITAPDGYRIKITFEDLDIEPSMFCQQDMLQIFSYKKSEESKESKDSSDSSDSSSSSDSSDSNDSSSPNNSKESKESRESGEVSKETEITNLGSFCGSDIPYPVITKEDENVVGIIFKTDDMISGKGFVLHYEASPFFTSVCDDESIQCRNRNCFKSYQKCDDVDDCGDGTDEEDCEKQIDKFPSNCGSQEIIPNIVHTQGADRIVGGEEAIPNSWPWQISLQDPMFEPSGHSCGGTLINAQWLVTAGHCVSDYTAGRPIGEFRIHLGAHNLLKKTRYLVTRWSANVISYPDLEGADRTNYNLSDDIALIKLNAPVQFSNAIQPACLPSFRNMTQEGMTCYATGWGDTYGTGSLGLLKQADVYIRPIAECSDTNPDIDGEKCICIKSPGKSPCSGDSGGPLNCKIDDKWYGSGATSYGPGSITGTPCAGPDNYGVYSSTGNKADWIKAVINKYS